MNLCNLQKIALIHITTAKNEGKIDMTREFQYGPIFSSPNPVGSRLTQIEATDPGFAQRIRADQQARSGEIKKLYWQVRTKRRCGHDDTDLQDLLLALQKLRKKEFQVRRFLVGVYTPEDD